MSTSPATPAMAASAINPLFTEPPLSLRVAARRRLDDLAVHHLVLVGHGHFRFAGDPDLGGRFDAERDAYAGDATIATDDVDAASPEGRVLREAALDAHEVGVGLGDEDRAVDKRHLVAQRSQRQANDTQSGGRFSSEVVV